MDLLSSLRFSLPLSSSFLLPRFFFFPFFIYFFIYSRPRINAYTRMYTYVVFFSFVLTIRPLFFLFPFTSPAHCTHRRTIDTDSRNDCSRVTGHGGICDFAFVLSFRIRPEREACPFVTDRFEHEILGIFTRPIEFLSWPGYNQFRET